jgi:hypothetical protein
LIFVYPSDFKNGIINNQDSFVKSSITYCLGSLVPEESLEGSELESEIYNNLGSYSFFHHKLRLAIKGLSRAKTHRFKIFKICSHFFFHCRDWNYSFSGNRFFPLL